MPLKTTVEYYDSVKRLKPELYAFGEQVRSTFEHPCFRPVTESIGLVYELAASETSGDFLTANSPFVGGRVNRFLHIHQDRDDLRKRFEISRALVRKHGACIGARCVGSAALNSVFAVTYEMDRELGTPYHGRFLDYLKYVQKDDLAVAGAMVDTRGDRSLRPLQQADPDAFVRVAEKRTDGIIVRGAKAHVSGAAIAHEIVVLPCLSMTADEQAYALSFATPSDAKGIVHLAEAPAPNFRRFVGEDTDFGNARYGVHGSTHIVFEDVFVPWERVFMCGEHHFTPKLVDYFTRLQRLATSGCKCGHRDLLIGASAVIADYNGVGNARHIRDKLIDMSFQSELSAGCALASIYLAERAPSGVYLPDPLMVNIAKLQGVKAIWDANFKMADIAGGLICTSPSSRDMRQEKVGRLIDKYFKGKATVRTEDRIRMMRLIEYLAGQGSVIPTESTHGAGSPQTQTLVIERRLSQHLEAYMRDARAMAGVDKQSPPD